MEKKSEKVLAESQRGMMSQSQANEQRLQSLRRMIRGKEISLEFCRQRVAVLEKDISELRLMLNKQIKNDTEEEGKS